MKALKHIFLLLVSLIFALSLVSCGNDDSGNTDDNSASDTEFVYKLNDLGEATIVRYKSKNTSVIVPNEIEGHPVTAISDSAFFNNTVITDITLPAGIIKIGKSAFEGCSSLKNINIPKSVELVSEKAFYNCVKLENLTIESGSALKEIGENAFYACRSLTTSEHDNANYLAVGESPYTILLSATNTSITSATIHPDTKIINSNAFAKCSSLTEIEIPKNVDFIGNSAFYGCTKLDTIYFNAVSMRDLTESSALFERTATTSIVMTVHIGEDVTRIPAYFMCGTSRLRYIRFVENAKCESIGKAAFKDTPIVEIALPKALKTIEDSAFADCSYIEEIKLNSENLNDFTPNNAVFSGAGENSGGIKLTLGRSAKRIPAYFCTSLNRSLYEVKFEDNSITCTFGKNAFLDCNSILKVDVTSRKGWCESTFENEYSNPLSYGNAILYVNNKSVTEGFALTEKIDFIADYAFIGYKNMEKIIIPKTVSYIGTKAFYGVDDLNHIYWSGNEAEWNVLEIRNGNSVIDTGIIYFYRDENLGVPTVAGNYWYLGADGTPYVWRNVVTD